MMPETEERPSENNRKFADIDAFRDEGRPHLVPGSIVAAAAPECDRAAEPRTVTAAFAAIPPPSVEYSRLLIFSL